MKTRILVVEDEVITAKAIQKILQTLGYEVLALVASGEDAVAKAATDRPDLVLMDITLEGAMDGIEAANQIHARLNIPLIYLTSHASQDFLERTKITAPYGYLIKPFRDRELHAQIEIGLYRHQAEEARKQAAAELQQHRDHLEALVLERTADLQKANRQLAREIAERNRAETEMAASGRRFRTVIETVAEGITLSDERGYFEIFNSAMEALTGYTREEAMQSGDFLRCLYPEPADYVQAHARIQDVLRSGGSRDLETTIRAKNGTRKTLLVSTALLPDQHRTWFLSAYRDITRRKQIERELHAAKEEADAANRAKSEFLANMSHELRTPLNAILGFAQILLEDMSLTALQRKRLNTIRSSGDHLLQLINEILNLAKIEAGRIELEASEFPLAPLLMQIADIMRGRAQQKGLAFAVELAPDLPAGICADERRLQEVLLNLIGNALKFTDKGHVTLRVNRLHPPPLLQGGLSPRHDAQESPLEGGRGVFSILRFEVEDTGIGIAPEQQEKIFLPFHQVGERRYAVQGTGLGLSICRRLVELMGGELHVASTLGKGSVFWFELRVSSGEKVNPRAAPRDQKIIGYEGTRRTVLVVDDDASNRGVLLGMLRPLGFQVLEAENGAEGIAKAMKHHPDVILLDLRMPELDGFEVAQQLRAVETLREAVIIAVSASVFAETRQQALAAGFDDFFVKPFQLCHLLDLLRTHLHLEWLSAQEPEALPQLAPFTGSDAQALAALSPAEATRLLEFAKEGNLKGVLTALNDLEQRYPAKLATFTKIRAFAEQYHFDEIAELLQI